jgi:hypothetical protein
MFHNINEKSKLKKEHRNYCYENDQEEMAL